MAMEKFISRLSLDQFNTILGADVITLLEGLGFRVRKSKLAELSLEIYSSSGILSNKKFRESIFSSLKKEEAQIIAEKIGFSSGNPWEYLKSKSYNKRSKNLKELYSFFDIQSPTDEDKTELKSIEKVSSLYPLFEHQRKAASEIIEILDSQKSCPRVLLHMPTGSGKTRTAMNVIAKYLRDDAKFSDLIIWIAHSEELCTQASEEFKVAWEAIGNREISIFRHYSEYKVDLNTIKSGVLFCGIKMLDSYLKNKTEEVLSLAPKTLMVVMDEAHQAVAPTYKNVLDILCREDRVKLLGLSATPGRSFMDTGEDVKLAEFFNWKKVKIKIEGYSSPINYLTSKGYLAEVSYEYIDYTPNFSENEINTITRSLDIPADILEKLGNDQVRNLKIIQSIKAETTENNKVLIFACGVKHSNFLATILRAIEIRARSVTGTTPTELRNKYIRGYRESDEVQVLINYNVLSTGFDAPKTNVAIITRPTNSVVLYSQMIGRAIRGPRVGGNKKCKIITVQDEIPGFRTIDESFTFWEDIWNEEN